MGGNSIKFNKSLHKQKQWYGDGVLMQVTIQQNPNLACKFDRFSWLNTKTILLGVPDLSLHYQVSVLNVAEPRNWRQPQDLNEPKRK